MFVFVQSAMHPYKGSHVTLRSQKIEVSQTSLIMGLVFV